MPDNEAVVGEYLAEAVMYDKVKPNTIIRTAINLPAGEPLRKNVTIGLVSHNLSDILDTITAKKVVNPLSYYKSVYSPIMIQGSMFGRKYIIKQDRNAIRKIITSHRLIWTMNANDDSNLLVDCGTKLRTFETRAEEKPPTIILKEYINVLKEFFVGRNNPNMKKILLFPVEEFMFDRTGAITTNKANLLYLIYYCIQRSVQSKPSKNFPNILEFDVDIILMGEKSSMVFNPSKVNKASFGMFRESMFRLFKMNIDETIKNDKQFQDQNLDKVVPSEPVAIDRIPDSLRKEVVKSAARPTSSTSTPSRKLIAADRDEADDDVTDISDIVQELPPDDIDDDAAPEEEEIDIDEITPATRFNHRVFEVGSNKEKKVLEKQSKVVVRGKTVEELSNVQGVDVPIDVSEHTTKLNTSNENMKISKFENYHNNYIEKVMPSDMVKALTALNHANTRFYVQDIQIDDTSDALNYKETWRVKFIDEKSIIHNLVVDIPKIYEGKFMYIGGNYKVMNNQNMMKPLVKISATRVQLVTNYNKIMIQRHGNKSTIGIEGMFKLSSYDEFRKLFQYGDSKLTNIRYKSVLEYDEYARKYTRFKNKNCVIYFNREDKRLTDIEQNTPTTFTIGKENDELINIDITTGLTQNGDSITDIIYRNLPDTAKQVFDKIKEGKRYLYTDCKLAGKQVPISILVSCWETFDKFMELAGIEHRFEEGKRLIDTGLQENSIKFEDGILYYKSGMDNEMLMNGLKLFDTAHTTYQSMNVPDTYNEYLRSVWGDYRSLNLLSAFKEFMVDPITLEICQNLGLPTTVSGLLVKGSHMLGTNSFLPESSDSLYRIRRDEVIPAILYKEITEQYERVRDTGGRQKLTLPRDAVIKDIMKLRTIEDYTALNPIVELEKDSAITAKGLSGLNDDGSYTEIKRLYSDSMIGKVGYTTANDASCGIVRTMSYEPTIANLRGMRDESVTDIHEYKDVNIFSAGELSTPGTCTHDDATRVGIN